MNTCLGPLRYTFKRTKTITFNHEPLPFSITVFSRYKASSTIKMGNGICKDFEERKTIPMQAFRKLRYTNRLLKQLPQLFSRKGCSFICWLENKCVIEVCKVKAPVTPMITPKCKKIHIYIYIRVYKYGFDSCKSWVVIVYNSKLHDIIATISPSRMR